MTKANMFKLYKAVQHEAHEYEPEHGYTMPKLWAKAKQDSWWADVSIWDYCRDNSINPEEYITGKSGIQMLKDAEAELEYDYSRNTK